jgi:hypothetical protein
MADVTTPVAPPAQESRSDDQGQVQEAAGQAKEKAQEAAGEAKQQASQKVREQVEQRSTQAGEQVATTAGDLRGVGEQLRSQGKDTPAKLAEQAADRTERLGSYLRDSDSDTILRDVEDFARRQPWAVVAGGLALGFAASRFLKASSSERYQSGRSPQPTTPQPAHPQAPTGDGYGQRAAVPPPPPAQAPTPGAYIPPR